MNIVVKVMDGSVIYNFTRPLDLPVDLGQRIEEAYRVKGIDCVKDFNGMFAFALLEEETGITYLVRDRYGIKPMYYYNEGVTFAWDSSIDYLLKNWGLRFDVDLEALAQYFTFQNMFDDRTLFKGIKMVPAGCYLKWDSHNRKATIHRYWDYKFDSSLKGLGEEDIAGEVKRLLGKAVSRMTTRGFGCFLSGGMDTGSIASLARRWGRFPTFTCGFDVSSATGLELGFDETEHAEFMANLLKTEHYEVILHAGDMEAILPQLIETLQDIRMGQCYPDYYTYRLASKFVKVVLSGAGGDELFGGYPWRYYYGEGAQSLDEYISGYYKYWQRIVRDEDRPKLFRPEVMEGLKDFSAFDIFRKTLRGTGVEPEGQGDYINMSMYFEIKTFLHGLFVIGDKIGQAHGLQVRFPFMDNDLVDYAMKIPPEMKIKQMDKHMNVDEDDVSRLFTAEGGKGILKKAMMGVIPDRILARHKQGFSAPDGSWFKGESMKYIKNLLFDPEARIYEYLQPGYVKARINSHMRGKENNRLFIWSCLSFEWWLRSFISGS